MDILTGAGFTGLTERSVPDEDRYSYLFDGFAGELDHALTGRKLRDNVTGATIWHSNADEPLILDYNTEFNPPGLYQPDAYIRSRCHPGRAPPAEVGGQAIVTGRSRRLWDEATGPR